MNMIAQGGLIGDLAIILNDPYSIAAKTTHQGRP